MESVLDLSQSEVRKRSDHVRVRSELMSSTYLPSNIQVLQIVQLRESLNFTCQAQNSFGLVVFNLSLVVKGFV